MEAEGRHSLFTMFAFGSNRHACWSPLSQEVAKHCLLMHFAYAHATFCFSKLPYEKTYELFSILLSLPIQLGQGIVEQLGGHLRVQTGSTHHRLTEIRILNLMETCTLSYYLRFIVKHFPRPLCLHFPIVPLWYSISSPISINTHKKAQGSG